MGRNKKNKNRRANNLQPERERTDSYDVVMENANFTTYYKAQKIVPESEWDDFVDHFKIPLPTTFRVTGSRANAQDLNEYIKSTYLPFLSEVEFEGTLIEPPKQIPWYPDGLAWHLNVPKKVIRKSPEFRKFQTFLVYETEVGNISRQEAVSMIPPLLMDVEPHHNVIDMCAAPGSKSAQLLEALHAEDSISGSSTPSGLLIANDSDYKRTHMLAHQAGRLASPSLMVTNLDASLYPSIKLPPNVDQGEQILYFDRILCDVPCSGDGTLRKNINIWRDWITSNANGLHSLQLRILLRAMKMLKRGGRLVYSTCSLNPVENEAIVAAAINESAANFSIVDVSDRLPNLKRRPGLTTWSVAINKDVTMVDSYAAYERDHLQRAGHKKFSPSYWPPANAAELCLERCLRIYPHDQDTGGFFVAVLEKAAPPVTSSKVDVVLEPSYRDMTMKRPAGDEAPDQPEPKRLKESAGDDTVAQEQETGGAWREDPYTYLSKGNEQLEDCLSNLRLQPSFPSSRLFVRNTKGDATRSIYLTNDIIKAILQNNDSAKLRLVNCGTKVLERHDSGQAANKFRFIDDGLPLVLPHVDPDAIMEAGVSHLRTLLQEYNPLCESFSQPFRSLIEQKELGCYLIRFRPEESDSVTLRHPLVLPLWKSNTSVSLLSDKKSKSALSLRVLGEDVTVAGKQEEEKKSQASARRGQQGAGSAELPTQPDTEAV